jgi:hypothetical protein
MSKAYDVGSKACQLFILGSNQYPRPHVTFPRMPLILVLILLILLFGGGGYYIGPGLGYYGGGGVSLVLALIVIYLLFGRGRSRL